jgi:hypothetical protein
MTEHNQKRLGILAVDDHHVMLTLYREALSFKSLKYESDFAIVLCEQGDAAVDAVSETIDREDPFTVVFLDFKLPPGPDSLWAGEQIRKIDP